MERGVFIGGILIAASLLIAVVLNSKSHPEPKPAAETTAPIVDDTAKSAVDRIDETVRVSSSTPNAPRDAATQPQRR